MGKQKLWTDYPVIELGDESGKKAPVRQVSIISYDFDKYCVVDVAGIRKEIKRGYIYKEPGRCGDVACISHRSAIMFCRHAGAA